MNTERAAAPGNASARLPNLIIPGVAKSGTTSLFWYLASHPDICPADVKQTNLLAPLRFGHAPHVSIEAYADHFAHAAGERYRLDASPQYFRGGPRVLDAVASLPNGPRVLLVLRDPVTRFESSYRYKQSRGRVPEEVSLDRFLDRCLEARRSGEDADERVGVHEAFSMGCYDDHVPRWLDAFSERARIVFFEDLAETPRAVLADLFRWLGIDPSVAQGIDTTVRNPTVRARSERVKVLARSINARLGSLAAFPELRRMLRRTYYRVNAEAVRWSPSPEESARLRELYTPSIRRLAEQLNARDLSVEAVPPWLSEAWPTEATASAAPEMSADV